jgi:hypothetical protein
MDNTEKAFEKQDALLEKMNADNAKMRAVYLDEKTRLQVKLDAALLQVEAFISERERLRVKCNDLVDKKYALLLQLEGMKGERDSEQEIAVGWEKKCELLELQNSEWEKLIRSAADDLYAYGKTIRQHKRTDDPGHFIMGVATNLHRACGIINGEDHPLPLAGAKLTEKRKCALCESEAVGKIGAEPRCDRHV